MYSPHDPNTTAPGPPRTQVSHRKHIKAWMGAILDPAEPLAPERPGSHVALEVRCKLQGFDAQENGTYQGAGFGVHLVFLGFAAQGLRLRVCCFRATGFRVCCWVLFRITGLKTGSGFSVSIMLLG